MLFSEPKIPQWKPIHFSSIRISVSVLFSEPKIPQYQRVRTRVRSPRRFQCSSASRKFLNDIPPRAARSAQPFQCSSASRKFHNRDDTRRVEAVEMFQCSSASRKFLNRVDDARRCYGSELFQCSSASRKFLNNVEFHFRLRSTKRFSALQRAENSSIEISQHQRSRAGEFQCSSASRKFLNWRENLIPALLDRRGRGFSALQRAENSSIRAEPAPRRLVEMFQCSSASRKFLNGAANFLSATPIPGFSALQRAENSSMHPLVNAPKRADRFSALQRAENSSIRPCRPVPSCAGSCFSALQRAENSSIV